MSDEWAKAIRQAIRASGLSLNELERRCGVSHVVLSRFLRGERTMTLPLAEKVGVLVGLQLRPTEPVSNGKPPPKRKKGGESS